MKDQLKDKAVFVVGLMAAFLAFSSYKEELSSIYIQIGQSAPSLSSLFLTFVIFLALSVYFYALDYLRYSFPRFQNSLTFKLTNFLANAFYSLAIFFPLLVLIFWVASVIPQPSPQHQKWLLWFDILGGLFLGGAALFNTISQIRRSKKRLIEAIDKSRARALDRALKLFNGEFYGETIMESFKVLEALLGEELLEKSGLYTQGMGGGRMIELAVKHEIIDVGTANEVKILQEMRNKAAHSDKPFSREEAEKALSIIRSVLGKTNNILGNE